MPDITADSQKTPPAVGSMPTLMGAAAHQGYRPVEIRLVTGDAGVSCNFWLGLARHGSESPSRLMDYKDIGALFTEAASTGVNEKGPLILSDTSVDPARFVFLMPVPDRDLIKQNAWVDEMMATMTSWAPGSAGLYLAPELVTGVESQDLLRQILSRIVAAGKTDEIFLLVGTHGTNSLLNVALSLKGELDSDDVKLFVFH